MKTGVLEVPLGGMKKGVLEKGVLEYCGERVFRGKSENGRPA